MGCHPDLAAWEAVSNGFPVHIFHLSCFLDFYCTFSVLQVKSPSSFSMFQHRVILYLQLLGVCLVLHCMNIKMGRSESGGGLTMWHTNVPHNVAYLPGVFATTFYFLFWPLLSRPNHSQHLLGLFLSNNSSSVCSHGKGCWCPMHITSCSSKLSFICHFFSQLLWHCGSLLLLLSKTVSSLLDFWLPGKPWKLKWGGSLSLQTVWNKSIKV